MIILVKVILVLALVVVLLQRKISIGIAMLAGSVGLWLLSDASWQTAVQALQTTALKTSTWEILLAMFFVMCLEFQLRTGGILDGLMVAMRELLRSDRALLALLPAFLGLLPSLGGAIFSAPLVENASRKYILSPEQKAVINYWFRHIWECTNPILPALLLASEIVHVPLPLLVQNMLWVTFLTLGLGWLVCLTRMEKRPTPVVSAAGAVVPQQPVRYSYVLLAFGPVLANLLLVVVFHFSAALSMGLVVLAMLLVLGQNVTAVQKMVLRSLDKKLLGGIFSVLLFQQMLDATGMVDGIVALLQAAGASAVLLVGATAFLVGLLTGTSQGFVAVTFPIIAALAPGDMDVISVGYIFGFAGQMLSPAHLCLLVTMEYFRADLLKALRPILLMDVVMVACALSRRAFWG